MNRIFRALLISLVVYSCSDSVEHRATDAEWRQWQSYLERATWQADSMMMLADSALIYARSHGMTDTGFYRPWELKARADRKAEKLSEAKVWLDSMQLHAAEAKHPHVEVRALNAIGQLLLQTPDWNMAEVPFRDALDLTEEAALTGEKPYVLLSWAAYLRRNNRRSAALDTLGSAEQLLRAAGNRKFLGYAYQLRGEILQDNNDLVGAETFYRSSLNEFEAIGDTLNMSRPYRRLAGILMSKEPDSAYFYFKAAVAADPRHQFANSYLTGLIQFAEFHLTAGAPNKALTFLDDAILFTTDRKNPSGLWNAWLLKGVALLNYSDTALSDSALRTALTVSLDNGQFYEYSQALTGWQEKFKKQGQTKAAGRLMLWADSKKFSARKDFQALQPKQVLELPASRRAAIQKRQRLQLVVGIGSFLLIVLVLWRLNIRRRNNAFTLYREHAASLAASRSYRRDTIANAPSSTQADGTQLIIDRERRILAMEVLFVTENLHLDPDLSFTQVCDKLKEPETAFGIIVKKMYDVDFETWLTEYRIEEAIRQMNAGADLKTLHKSCGFKDAAVFNKTFENITGLKPGSYLKWPKPPIR